MDFQPLKYIYKPAGHPGAYTLLLLHGTGGNEADLIPLVENFGSNYNILSLRGNVTENGMPRFFKRLGMGIFDEKDLHFRTDEIVAFVKALATTEDFDTSKIIALGYSNGANIAGAALLKHPEFLAGAILFRPMQPFKDLQSAGTANKIPVFFSSGKMDPTVNQEATLEYMAALERLGYDVAFHNFHTAHSLVNEDVELAAQWLQTNFA